jgi:hypothetical protein
MFPKSLSHPDDLLESAEQWQRLSEQLFEELLTARHASKPPTPGELWQEWSKWVDVTPEGGPNNVSKDTVRDWLRAYEASLSPERGETSSYVRGVAALLRRDPKAGADQMYIAKAKQVPIVVVQAGRPAVLILEVTGVEGGTGQQWLHPSFEHRSTDVSAGGGTFAEGLSRTWETARTADSQPASFDIFWRVRSADGGPLPLMKLDGPSASGAAYRAFWHIAKGLHIDPYVYVLADATTCDGYLQAVGHLREKIIAINAARSSPSRYPPTLIAAVHVSADDLAVLDAAREWADVRLVATTGELTAVRRVNELSDSFSRLAAERDIASPQNLEGHIGKPGMRFLRHVAACACVVAQHRLNSSSIALSVDERNALLFYSFVASTRGFLLGRFADTRDLLPEQLPVLPSLIKLTKRWYEDVLLNDAWLHQWSEPFSRDLIDAQWSECGPPAFVASMQRDDPKYPIMVDTLKVAMLHGIVARRFLRLYVSRECTMRSDRPSQMGNAPSDCVDAELAAALEKGVPKLTPLPPGKS